jgi:hypothetical protein
MTNFASWPVVPIQYVNREHPLSRAMYLTAEAIDANIKAFRAIPATKANTAKRDAAWRALERTESIHAYIFGQHKATQGAWLAGADSAPELSALRGVAVA